MNVKRLVTFVATALVLQFSLACNMAALPPADREMSAADEPPDRSTDMTDEPMDDPSDGVRDRLDDLPDALDGVRDTGRDRPGRDDPMRTEDSADADEPTDLPPPTDIDESVGSTRECRTLLGGWETGPLSMTAVPAVDTAVFAFTFLRSLNFVTIRRDGVETTFTPMVALF